VYDVYGMNHNETENKHKTRFVEGHAVHIYREVSSTNTVAAQWAGKGAADGTLVVSAFQNAGSGRRGRAWHAPPGAAITMTVVVHGDKGLPIAAQYMLLAGVAVADAIRDASGVEAGIKWPNDVLIEGRKICGILAQASTLSDGSGYAVIGIGINVNQYKEDFQAEFRGRSTSLRIECGKRASRMGLIRAFLRAWDGHMKAFRERGYAYIREQWIARNVTLGKEISVNLNGEEVVGMAEDVRESGALVMRLADGSSKELFSEEISLGYRNANG